MINLIRIELYRFSKHWFFPVMILLSVYFSIAILDQFFSSKVQMNSFLDSGKTTFENSFNMGVRLIGPIILSGFFVGSDYSNRTLQEKIASGHTRMDIVLSKTIVYSALSAFFLLLTPLFTTGVVTYVNGWGGDFDAHYFTRVILLVFLTYCSSVCIYPLISFICRDIAKTLLVSSVFSLLFAELGDLLRTHSIVFRSIYPFYPTSQLSLILSEGFSQKDCIQVLFSITITSIVCVGASFMIFNQQDLNQQKGSRLK